MISKATQELIAATCNKYQLPYELILSVIWQESRGITHAYRFEPAFYAKRIIWRTPSQLSGFVPQGIPTLATEKVARATSWGLMQVMGETARVTGFQKSNLTELLIPEIGIEYGCRYYAQCLKRTTDEKTKHEQALIYYNGGRDYPALIMKHMKRGNYQAMLESAER